MFALSVMENKESHVPMKIPRYLKFCKAGISSDVVSLKNTHIGKDVLGVEMEMCLECQRGRR